MRVSFSGTVPMTITRGFNLYLSFLWGIYLLEDLLSLRLKVLRFFQLSLVSVY